MNELPGSGLAVLGAAPVAPKAQRLESHVRLPWQCVEVEVVELDGVLVRISVQAD